MECAYCNIQDSPWVLAAGGDWVMVLANNQYTLGRVVLAPRRYVGSVYELLPADWVAWGMLARRIEKAAQAAFGATRINFAWGCNTTQPAHPAPHQHVHVFPRYMNPVVVGEETFDDPAPGKFPDLNTSREALPETRLKIFNRLIERL